MGVTGEAGPSCDETGGTVTATPLVGSTTGATATQNVTVFARSHREATGAPTMTTAPLYVDYGYSDFSGFRYGSLTTMSFDIDGVTYTAKVMAAWGSTSGRPGGADSLDGRCGRNAVGIERKDVQLVQLREDIPVGENRAGLGHW